MQSRVALLKLLGEMNPESHFKVIDTQRLYCRLCTGIRMFVLIWGKFLGIQLVMG